MNISEMLTRNARQHKGDIALIHIDSVAGTRKVITWKDLDEQSNKTANALKNLGIKKGDKVLHLMRNSIEWIIAYFGIIRTGAWVVPLNFRFTSADIKYCADIAEAKAFIFEEEFTERIEAIRRQLLTIKNYIGLGKNLAKDVENFEQLLVHSSSQSLDVELRDENECGLYFTSGTTGAPKPILLTHKNMESVAISLVVNQQTQPNDIFLCMGPFYHTGGLMHWFRMLILGGRTVLLTGKVTPKNILETVVKEKITILWLLVPWCQDIISALDRGEIKKEDYNLNSLRLMFMGAQPIPPALVKRWKEYYPHTAYETSYGLSESTGPSCVHLGLGNERKLGAIGISGFNWDTRIVNKAGEDVAQGEIGELVVKGNGVMKEYYKNPEKTAETIKNGWLYSGDMAKMDEDGFIYLVDRKKDVIISGGENVYPVEIEDTLRRHPKVFDVGVIGLPDTRLVEIVTAVITPKPGETLTEEEINAFCEQNLPRYKRPRRIIFDNVPRNPSGKIEKPKMREKYAGIKESFKT